MLTHAPRNAAPTIENESFPKMPPAADTTPEECIRLETLSDSENIDFAIDALPAVAESATERTPDPNKGPTVEIDRPTRASALVDRQLPILTLFAPETELPTEQPPPMLVD